MDLTEAAAPRSDQLNYDDLTGGPTIVTIAEVRQGTTEQPVEVHTTEFPGRPWKPSKGMIRVLVRAWGRDSAAYAGRRVKLYGDPSVTWAGKAVGGIRIAALSDIDGPLTVPLTVARGKRAAITVHPIPQDDGPEMPNFASRDEARSYYMRRQHEGASPAELAAIQAAAPKE